MGRGACWATVCGVTKSQTQLSTYVCVAWTLSPQNLYLEVLPSSTPECDYIWKWDFYRDNQLKMRSSRWALIQNDCCLCERKKKKLETHAHASTHQGTPKRAGKLWETSMEQTLPQSFQKNSSLPTVWSWTSRLQNWDTISVLVI